MKEGNLGTHMARVHPSVPRRKYAEMKIRKPRPSRGELSRWVPLFAILLVVALGAGVYFATVRPATSSGGPASFYADHKFYDFQHVEQATVQHAFPFENRGPGDLVVWGLQSSCDCTSAHVVIGGVEGPHFSMHDAPNWQGTVPPWSTASIVVIYDATQMPDLYAGQRSVFMRTNDAANPEVTFVIQVHEPTP